MAWRERNSYCVSVPVGTGAVYTANGFSTATAVSDEGFDHVNGARLVTLLGLVIVALALAATSALGAPPQPTRGAHASSADTFIRTELHLRMSRRYAHLYSKLHPAQQAFISRDKFIDCENQRDEAYGLTVKLIAFKVIRSYEQTILIPGTRQTAQSTAVKYKYTVRDRRREHFFDYRRFARCPRERILEVVGHFEGRPCVQGRPMPDYVTGVRTPSRLILHSPQQEPTWDRVGAF